MKTQTTHTPGPWRIDVRPLATRNLTITGAGKWLATVHEDSGIRTVQVHPGEWESAANARLIAAAPELLEALIDCANQMELVYQNDLPKPLRNPFTNALIRARNAVRKTEGR